MFRHQTPRRRRKKVGRSSIYWTICTVFTPTRSTELSAMFHLVCLCLLSNYILLSNPVLGMPASCSFKACIANKELCERNGTIFSCCHTEQVACQTAAEPEQELLVEECRLLIVTNNIAEHFSKTYHETGTQGQLIYRAIQFGVVEGSALLLHSYHGQGGGGANKTINEQILGNHPNFELEYPKQRVNP